ncbi:hypothetical protein [Alteromonas oceanisediminis]|uniref:hypothetical protein n=1 Tax=Alteromonas oceanisediminis TaxID=2836180 RepID=UPI001BDB4DA1|nr:hypothetical protein [Alteromonas oceanisediminis]MBT0587078.1 hypothetical protein [Alteromonas oceanisediminis]
MTDVDTGFRDTTASPKDSCLGLINKRFHNYYSDKKSKALHKVKSELLVVVKIDSRLISICDGKYTVYTINSDRYHALKSLAHLTMAIFFQLTSNDLDTEIGHVEELVESAFDSIDLEISKELKKVTEDFIHKVKQAKHVEATSLLQYSTSLEPIYAKLMMASAMDEAENLKDALAKVLAMHPKNSSQIFTVTMGAHQPRYKELSKLVFQRWLHGMDEHIVNTDHHVRYLEGGCDIEEALNLVSTAIVDREIAQLFLGSAEGLNQDVLGVVAEKAIANVWGEPNGAR